jgi:anti-sigma factor ChrR (cupin superfamily)
VKSSPTADAARAALYALGALPDDQRAGFEERLRASSVLRGEVAALRAVTDELALAPEPVAPSPEVRERLLARIADQAAAAKPAIPDLLFALRADDVWLPVCPGIEQRELARTTGGASYLLRVAPGGSIPNHGHRRVEHSFVVSGTLEVEGILCHAGDYHRAAIGSAHAALYSREGCLLLIVEASA